MASNNSEPVRLRYGWIELGKSVFLMVMAIYWPMPRWCATVVALSAGIILADSISDYRAALKEKLRELRRIANDN